MAVSFSWNCRPSFRHWIGRKHDCALSMLIIGALLADTDLKKIFIGWDVYYGSC